MSQLLCTLYPSRFVPPIGSLRIIKADEDDPPAPYHVECHSAIKGHQMRELIMKMLRYETTTATIAGWLDITPRAALHHLSVLEKEGRVKRTASRSSRANRWIAA